MPALHCQHCWACTCRRRVLLPCKHDIVHERQTAALQPCVHEMSALGVDPKKAKTMLHRLANLMATANTGNLALHKNAIRCGKPCRAVQQIISGPSTHHSKAWQPNLIHPRPKTVLA
jgi:hypothetical protein